MTHDVPVRGATCAGTGTTNKLSSTSRRLQFASPRERFLRTGSCSCEWLHMSRFVPTMPVDLRLQSSIFSGPRENRSRSEWFPCERLAWVVPSHSH
eukprot:4027735-Karenia_brevis.AAC.1